MGHVYAGHDRADRFFYGLLSPALAAWARGRDVVARRGHACGGLHRGALRRSVLAGGVVRSGTLDLGLAAGSVWISRIRAAGLDAAGPAGLSLDLHESQRGRVARRWGDRDSAADCDAARNRPHRRRGADHPRADLPLRLPPDRLRRAFRVPLAGLLRYDPQDARPGIACDDRL